jgi:hemin uptake protein HemP
VSTLTVPARAAKLQHAVGKENTAVSSAADPKVVQLAELLGSAQSIHIAHGEQVYRLQVTKAGKLILTK